MLGTHIRRCQAPSDPTTVGTRKSVLIRGMATFQELIQIISTVTVHCGVVDGQCKHLDFISSYIVKEMMKVICMYSCALVTSVFQVCT